MKRTAIILGIALTLCSGTGNLRAHGGCYGFWPFWPLVLGAGIAIASVASAHNSAPTYVYAAPAYPYGYTQPLYSHNTSSAQTPAAANAPVAPPSNEISSWVPSSPGTGHWVRDPTPYRYDPGVRDNPSIVAAEPTAPIVTVNRSVGNVPVYTVTR